jgi:hypothetical protein
VDLLDAGSDGKLDRVPAPIHKGRGSCPGNSEPNAKKIQTSALELRQMQAGAGSGMDSPH